MEDTKMKTRPDNPQSIPLCPKTQSADDPKPNDFPLLELDLRLQDRPWRMLDGFSAAGLLHEGVQRLM